ncbi:MAG: sensor histidine kinase [Hyphomicrobiales bacterium]
MAKLGETIWPWWRGQEGDEQPFSGPLSADSAEELAAHGAHSTSERMQEDVEAMAAVGMALRDPFFLLDLEGQILAANGPAVEAFDLAPGRHHVSAAIRTPQVLEAIDQVIRTGSQAVIDYERRGQVDQRFEVSASMVSPSEFISVVTLILRDLTGQEKVERMRADFVANASHELRTPLSSLLGFIETLQGPAKDDEKARGEFLELMRLQANRMARLIHELLSLNRIELNAHRLPEGTANLNALLQHVVEALSPLSKEAKTKIHIDLPEPPLELQGDWDELVQVFQNLVENALKYGAGGDPIEITVRTEGETQTGNVEIEIRDHGPGISPEYLPRLTERFYRVDVKESRGKGGTGLGLAIVKHILNRHRGKLSIRSELGDGSRFIVRLPRAIGPGQ